MYHITKIIKMKKIKYLGIPFIFFMYLTIAIPFQSCDKPDDDCDEQDSTMVYKPNIYIYPNEKIQLDVKLKFPQGGRVVTSIPKYSNGWNISVDTNGLINNTYKYLFYESSQPNIWQKKDGWVIPASRLESFFRKNMKEYGFEGDEIKDFIDYWIPKFKDYDFYLIYPETKNIISKVIKLNMSKQPDNLLRLFYVVKGSNHSNIELIEPKIEKFQREGYYITEWGVILEK